MCDGAIRNRGGRVFSGSWRGHNRIRNFRPPPGRSLTSYGAHGAVVQRLAVHDAGVALDLPGEVQVGAHPGVGEGRVLGAGHEET